MARLAPLQLLARRLAFADPFTGPPREFESHLALSGLRKRSRRPAAAQQRPSSGPANAPAHGYAPRHKLAGIKP